MRGLRKPNIFKRAYGYQHIVNFVTFFPVCRLIRTEKYTFLLHKTDRAFADETQINFKQIKDISLTLG